jgi:hypothetical protein
MSGCRVWRDGGPSASFGLRPVIGAEHLCSGYDTELQNTSKDWERERTFAVPSDTQSRFRT